MRRISLVPLAVAFTALCVVGTAAFAARIAEPAAGSSSIDWQLNASFEGTVLTVSTPGGAVIRREFAAGQTPSFSLFDQKGQARQAGSYIYELRAVPAVDPAVRSRLAAARATGDDRAAVAEQARAGLRDDLVQSGSFAIVNGAFEMGGRSETPSGPRSAAAGAMRNVTAADQVIPDDLIVQGSACVGLDCVNNENFGFDTIRMKENNLRIHFDDTSTQVGFPANDWRLIANDSASGGSSKFSIEDSTGAKTPFTITAGASTDSIFVDSIGRVGLRSSTPVLDLHIKTSNTPAIRLEQTNSGGFTAQTWDIGANEANFFVRDVTGGSTLPFRIRPGAPTSSVDISSDGDVGIGTASPDNALHVECDVAADACVKVHNANAAGFSGFSLAEEGDTTAFFFGTDNTNNNTRLNSTNNFPMVFLTESVERVRIQSDGDVGIACNNPTSDLVVASGGGCANPASNLNAGAAQFTVTSSRTVKEHLTPIKVPDLLDKMAGVDVYRYDFIDGPKDRIGLMAEDFHEIFGRGSDQLLSGDEVQMALWLAVKELTARNRELAERLAALEAKQQ